jgi:hypothetical protein
MNRRKFTGVAGETFLIAAGTYYLASKKIILSGIIVNRIHGKKFLYS